MWDFINRVLEVIFPSHPCVKIIKNVTDEIFLLNYEPHYKSKILVLSHYHNKLITAAITANKFHNSKRAAKLLTLLIERWIKANNLSEAIFVPIPLSQKRLRARGYNQVEKILSEANDCTLTVLPLLKKIKDTPPQTSLNRTDRLHNVKNIFTYVPPTNAINIQLVVIIDDVVTTGATLLSAERALAPHLPKSCRIICLALAH